MLIYMSGIIVKLAAIIRFYWYLFVNLGMKSCFKCKIEKDLNNYINDSIICIECHSKRLDYLMNEAEKSLNGNINCVYCIKCIVNNKMYIGSAAHFGKRLVGHKNQLQTNRHPSKSLQADFNKYGLLNFDFYVLEHNLLNHMDREYELINEYLVNNVLYNNQTGKTRISKYKRGLL